MSSWSDGQRCSFGRDKFGPQDTPGRQGLTLEIDGDLQSGLQVNTAVEHCTWKPAHCPKAGLHHSSSEGLWELITLHSASPSKGYSPEVITPQNSLVTENGKNTMAECDHFAYRRLKFEKCKRSQEEHVASQPEWTFLVLADLKRKQKKPPLGRVIRDVDRKENIWIVSRPAQSSRNMGATRVIFKFFSRSLNKRKLGETSWNVGLNKLFKYVMHTENINEIL